MFAFSDITVLDLPDTFVWTYGYMQRWPGTHSCDITHFQAERGMTRPAAHPVPDHL
jgi:hypothetical protein